MDTENINPETYLGFGTWQYWGSGRVPIGVNTDDTDFNTAEKTGGNKTITLTTAQLPSHNHTFTGTSHSHSLNNHTHTYAKADSNTGSHTLTVNEIPSHNHPNVARLYNGRRWIYCWFWNSWSRSSWSSR